MEKQRIVLLGAGHANTQLLMLLSRMSKELLRNLEILLVSDGESSYYSGMLPGTIAEQYTLSQMCIDLRLLTAANNATLLPYRAVQLDPFNQTLLLESGEQIKYSFLCINIGSTNTGYDIRGVREFSVPTRPLKDFLSRVSEKQDALQNSGTAPVVLVVGAGAAGVELAFALLQRLSRAFAEVSVSLITRSSEILPGFPENIRRKVLRELQKQNISVLLNSEVAQIRENTVELRNCQVIPGNFIVWAAGASPIMFDSALPTCPRGYILVTDSLQSVQFSEILAVGDCITMESQPEGFPAKAGVYSVREAPILFKNLKSLLKAQLFHQRVSLTMYRPQRNFLVILNLCNGSAIAFKGAIVYTGKLAWYLKRRIDSNFMNKFKSK